MPKVWQPLEPGREIRLWRGRHHVMGGCYILTANMAAGRFLPRGFAVCELVDGAGSSLPYDTLRFAIDELESLVAGTDPDHGEELAHHVGILRRHLMPWDAQG